MVGARLVGGDGMAEEGFIGRRGTSASGEKGGMAHVLGAVGLSGG